MPTDGRCKKRSPSYQAGENDYQMPKTMKGMREEILRLLEENEALKKQAREAEDQLRLSSDKINLLMIWKIEPVPLKN